MKAAAAADADKLVSAAAMADAFLDGLRAAGVGEEPAERLRRTMMADAQAAAAAIAARHSTVDSRNKKLPTSRRSTARLRTAHWNMARLTKTQVQLLDALPLDLVLLTETHDTAAALEHYALEHYTGPNRMLTSGRPEERDYRGAAQTAR